MKKITYKIFRKESSKRYSFELPQDVWEFLDSPVFGIYSKLIPMEIIRRIDSLRDNYFDLHYDIIYYILAEKLGIGNKDIEDLTIEDYTSDEIIVHVYLN